MRRSRCDDGDTRKTLWRAHDGTLIESVLMRYPDRITLCVSSQAGCGMACPFCATGQGGLQRNLSTAEIVEQVRLAARAARDGAMGEPGRLSNVVFMGMGEPLANYNRVLAAVKLITAPAPHGLGISARSVTVSTVGLVPAIERADRGEPAGPAGGLAAHPRRRTARHPGSGERPLEDRRGAARRRARYADTTGRRVSIEYALIRDINDQPWRADLLGELLREHLGQLVHVNLIPLNPTPGSQWDASPQAGAGRVRPAGARAGRGLHGPRHPRSGDRRRLRPAGR